MKPVAFCKAGVKRAEPFCQVEDETNVFPTCALNEFEPKTKNEFSAVGGKTRPVDELLATHRTGYFLSLWGYGMS
ncbi:hypothetical protein SAMN05216390_10672 [Lachnospiraceae bacterium KH1T2]|nr:hypothetical protein SAMN05216390_10672 [Lachnospiraceae bacterium KH1T2]